jgi:hypothetical protein
MRVYHLHLTQYSGMSRLACTGKNLFINNINLLQYSDVF